jgi:hypothetical protein
LTFKHCWFSARIWAYQAPEEQAGLHGDIVSSINGHALIRASKIDGPGNN